MSCEEGDLDSSNQGYFRRPPSLPALVVLAETRSDSRVSGSFTLPLMWANRVRPSSIVTIDTVSTLGA
jgi:hypothetical protein